MITLGIIILFVIVFAAAWLFDYLAEKAAENDEWTDGDGEDQL